LLSLSKEINNFQPLTLQPLAIFSQQWEGVQKWAAKNPIPFPLLSDSTRQVAKDYGVYVGLSYDSIHLARPATFLIAPNGTIQHVYVSSHVFDRASLPQILAALAKCS
jgi:peroxiredoxin Q/BCP